MRPLIPTYSYESEIEFAIGGVVNMAYGGNLSVENAICTPTSCHR